MLKTIAAAQTQDAKLKQQADEQMRAGHFDNAVNLYKQALLVNPENPEVTLDLAKTYKLNADYTNAIPYFEKAEKQNPNEIEIVTLLGECYKHKGLYNKAEVQFQKALNIDPQYDFASRNLLDTQNLRLACYDRSKAFKERKEAAEKNLKTAVGMVIDFFPNGYTNDMKDVKVEFGQTEQMGGRYNIAQYEDKIRKTTITNDFIYANPGLTATYVAHEFVHAKDKDPYTSIREEQDAFRTQAQFWIKNVKNVKDPEMDYVIELYKKSPEILDKRVAEIYRLRDKDIPETSPNHPPSNKKVASQHLDSAAGQPLKAYDVIV